MLHTYFLKVYIDLQRYKKYHKRKIISYFFLTIYCKTLHYFVSLHSG